LSIVDKERLFPGVSVLCGRRNKAIVGILENDSDPAVNSMKVDKAPLEK